MKNNLTQEYMENNSEEKDYNEEMIENERDFYYPFRNFGVIDEDVDDEVEEECDGNVYDDEYGDNEYNDYEEQHYDMYNGTYAQDEAGLSDEAISDAFDGDPSCYWNID